MISKPTLHKALTTAAAAVVLLVVGCESPWKHYYQQPVAAPLGSISDSVWQRQEANAERSDFVVYEHEFAADSEFLNTGGEDHVKEIAARLAAGQDAQVLVERGSSSARAGTTHRYRVHPNPELDMRRREIVVRCLTAMGISDADLRVVVAPALAPSYTHGEGPGAYAGGAGAGGFGGFFFGAGRSFF